MLNLVEDEHAEQNERRKMMFRFMKGENGAFLIKYIEDIVYPVTIQTSSDAYAYICGRVSLLSDLKRIKNLADAGNGIDKNGRIE